MDERCDCDGGVREAYLTKLSSSLFLALIGGSDLSALSPPAMKKAAVEKVVARVAIAS
jgi:hypothetical protein